MRQAKKALCGITTDELKKLLQALYQRHLECPLTIVGLTRIGLQYRANELLATLRGLDERAVHVVLVAVMAEREHAVAVQDAASRVHSSEEDQTNTLAPATDSTPAPITDTNADT